MLKERKFLITGSVAMRHWFPDFKRIPGDVDILSPASVSSSTPSKLLVETHWPALADEILLKNKDDLFVDPDILLTISRP